MFGDPSFTMGAGEAPFARPGTASGAPGVASGAPGMAPAPGGQAVPSHMMGVPSPDPIAANLFSSVPEPSRANAAAKRSQDDSDESGNGEEGRASKRTAEQKAHAIQEKNRRAQKRFRERQVRAAVVAEARRGVGREGGRKPHESESRRGKGERAAGGGVGGGCPRLGPWCREPCVSGARAPGGLSRNARIAAVGRVAGPARRKTTGRLFRQETVSPRFDVARAARAALALSAGQRRSARRVMDMGQRWRTGRGRAGPLRMAGRTRRSTQRRRMRERGRGPTAGAEKRKAKRRKARERAERRSLSYGFGVPPPLVSLCDASSLPCGFRSHLCFAVVPVWVLAWPPLFLFFPPFARFFFTLLFLLPVLLLLLSLLSVSCAESQDEGHDGAVGRHGF